VPPSGHPFRNSVPAFSQFDYRVSISAFQLPDLNVQNASLSELLGVETTFSELSQACMLPKVD
jgi:hypothetical protein